MAWYGCRLPLFQLRRRRTKVPMTPNWTSVIRRFVRLLENVRSAASLLLLCDMWFTYLVVIELSVHVRLFTATKLCDTFWRRLHAPQCERLLDMRESEGDPEYLCNFLVCKMSEKYFCKLFHVAKSAIRFTCGMLNINIAVLFSTSSHLAQLPPTPWYNFHFVRMQLEK